MWKAGDSISVIAKAVGSPAGSIFSILLPFGGVYQAPRRRRDIAITFAERDEISRGLATSESVRSISRRLGRAPSTISREITRNRGATKYRALDADDRTWRRATRPKLCVLAQRPLLCAYVADRLREDWSPEHIAGTLYKDHPIGSRMRVSHETIYKSLFIESRGVLARELRAHLRSGRPMRRSVHNTVTDRYGVRSRARCPSPSGRRTWTTASCPATGKAIYCSGAIGPNSRPWSNAPRASRSSFSSLDAICTR